jgi:hypothetical protein
LFTKRFLYILGKLAGEYSEVGQCKLLIFFWFIIFIFLAKEKLAQVAEDVKASGKEKFQLFRL